MRVQLPCLAVIAAAVWLATTASAYTSGSGSSGSGYDYVDDNTECIRPPGASSGANPTRNIGSALLNARCLAVCLEEQQFDDEYLYVRSKDGYSYLSESDLESDCTLYNQVYECARGCVVGNSYPSTTECRQECISQCESTYEDNSGNQGGCEKVCNYEECDNGCSYASSLAISSNEQPAKPQSSLQLRRDSSTPVGVYAVEAPDERKWPLQPVSEKGQFVTFLIQVEEVEQAETFYIVKAGLPSRLSLTFLSCEEVVVYHSHVNQYGRSHFSPHSSMFCVEGVKVTQPTAVINTSVSYIYDSRPGYFGHYCMNMNWTNPSDPLSVSQFTVEVATPSYGANSCGITIAKHVQPASESPVQTATICATSQESAPISGCSYTVIISTVPAGSSFETVATSTIVNVPYYKPDDFILECVRWLNDDNLFAVNVTIHLSEYLANEGVVAGFVFLVTRDELLKGGTLNEDTIFSPYSKNLPEASSVIKETVKGLLPYAENDVNYTIVVRPRWSLSASYNPSVNIFTCSVNAQSLRPDSVRDITINKVAVLRDSHSFVLSVEWEEPSSFNGEFAKYEVIVGPTSMQLDSTDIPTQFEVTNVLNVSQTQLKVETLFDPSVFCYYLQIRSANTYLPSNWSEPVVIALDERCDHYEVIATPSMSSSVSVESQITPTSPLPSNETAQLQIQVVSFIIVGVGILVAIVLVICVISAFYWLGRRYRLSGTKNQVVEVDDYNDIKFNDDTVEKSTSLQEVKPSEV